MYQLSVEGWIYFGLLTLILAFLSNFLAQKKSRDVGKIIYEIKVEKNKLLLTVMLLIACTGLMAMLFVGEFNTDKLMRVLLILTIILIICYNLTKKRIITELGIGYKNIFGKAYASSIIKWGSIKEWKWIDYKKILLVDVDVNGSIVIQRWKVDSAYRDNVDKGFKLFAKNKMK